MSKTNCLRNIIYNTKSALKIKLPYNVVVENITFDNEVTKFTAQLNREQTKEDRDKIIDYLLKINYGSNNSNLKSSGIILERIIAPGAVVAYPVYKVVVNDN